MLSQLDLAIKRPVLWRRVVLSVEIKRLSGSMTIPKSQIVLTCLKSLQIESFLLT